MAHIRIWSWTHMPSRPGLVRVLRDELGIRLAEALDRADTLLTGGVLDVGHLEVRALAPLKAALVDLGANVEIEL